MLFARKALRLRRLQDCSNVRRATDLLRRCCGDCGQHRELHQQKKKPWVSAANDLPLSAFQDHQSRSPILETIAALATCCWSKLMLWTLKMYGADLEWLWRPEDVD
mmetsp:Transcript_32417/g.61048  ORF Transcript_32417/g.61048 Transcript_32417/m.61048 type:complete len:106 (+) Transcript_32417:60-377(+)